MSTPTDPGGLGPLRAEPVSLYPPFRQRPDTWDHYPDRHDFYNALLTALGDIELGSWDLRILHWLAGWDAPTVASICSLIHRARAAEHPEGSNP